MMYLKKIKLCAKYAKSIGLEVHAGHGMDYKVAKILTKILTYDRNTIKLAKKYAKAIRWRTPNILKEDQSQSCRMKGNALSSSPIINIVMVLKIILLNRGPYLHISYLSNEKRIDIPILKRKKGNTRSVRVHPCHCA